MLMRLLSSSERLSSTGASNLPMNLTGRLASRTLSAQRYASINESD
jgi:hypothetical protein